MINLTETQIEKLAKQSDHEFTQTIRQACKNGSYADTLKVQEQIKNYCQKVGIKVPLGWRLNDPFNQNITKTELNAQDIKNIKDGVRFYKKCQHINRKLDRAIARGEFPKVEFKG